ncbi:MAG: DUF4926 domain-containing protein [Cyanobacteria bacterium RI_101]|nr:DUF4926 domain-containing protein [Cyanobacteria bacterium RI_101]
MKLLDVVALIEDLPELNLYQGNVGTIVEEYEPNIFEVEFSDSTGKAYAIETLNASQLMTLYHHPLQINKESICATQSLTDYSNLVQRLSKAPS